MPKSPLMNIFTYRILSLLLLPVVLFRLILRSFKEPKYLNSLMNRLGFYSESLRSLAANKKIIWIHCVSVGETKAALPLLKILLKQYPNHHFLISHSTPTGKETELIDSKRIHRCFIPFDIKVSVNLFLNFFKPSIGLIFETEIWPIMLCQCKNKGIPVFLMNARLSQKSMNKYLKFKNFSSYVLGKFSMICVQSKIDLQNFRKLTTNDISITGNTKFDYSNFPKISSRKLICKKNFKITDQIVIVAGSTRRGEEQLVLDCFKNLQMKNLILIIVPRHPQRFLEVENLIKSSDLSFIRKSNLAQCNETPQVILGDSMGELSLYYELANIVILGGSLKDFGSQNIIEPLMLGKSTIVGPSIYNFKDVIEKAEKQKLIFKLKKVEELEELIKSILLGDKHDVDLKSIKNFLKKESGASQRLANIISQSLL